MKMRKITAAAAAVILAASFVSCGNTDNVVRPEPENPEITEVKSDEAVTEAVKTGQVSGMPEETAAVTEYIDPTTLEHNPLTGEYGFKEEAVGKRPVAVMINNISDALPQYGISKADYIYETVVEGGITRLMAVFADYTSVPVLCSVRSCRYYYPLIANGLDAVYMHWGSDMTIAAETLQRIGIDRFDGGDGWDMFYYDENRMNYYAQEHSGCLDGTQIEATLNRTGMRTESKYGSADIMKFADGIDFIDISDEECDYVNITFSYSYFSTFTYDKKTKTYLKQYSGTPHIDASNDEQLAFTNVFALKTWSAPREDGYHMDVGLSSGEGYYFSGGRVKKINWSKDDDYSNFKFTDAETGEEITVNRGKCYMGLCDSVSF